MRERFLAASDYTRDIFFLSLPLFTTPCTFPSCLKRCASAIISELCLRSPSLISCVLREREERVCFGSFFLKKKILFGCDDTDSCLNGSGLCVCVWSVCVCELEREGREREREREPSLILIFFSV